MHRLRARRRRRGDRADAHSRRQAARARASVPRERRGGDGRRGARGVSRRPVSAARGARARSCSSRSSPTIASSSRRRSSARRSTCRSAGRAASSSTSRRRTRDTCSRSFGSPATKPRSAPAIRSTSCSASSGLQKVPRSLVCFDISHAQGTDTVASCVWFQNGRPYRAEYRKFKVKTVEGIDDFASMNEVVTRYFTRRLEEEQPLPDLVVIDGGKGQLNAAARGARRRSASARCRSISLAKREEEIFVLGRSESLRLPRRSPALRVLQQARDEAHRFAITFQRKRRSVRTITSELLRIPGIGEAKRRQLLDGVRQPAGRSRRDARSRSPRCPASAARRAERIARSVARQFADAPRRSQRRRAEPAQVTESRQSRTSPTTRPTSREHLAPRMFRLRRPRVGRRARHRLSRSAASRFSFATIRPCRRATRSRRAGTCGATRAVLPLDDGETPVSLGEGTHADARAADARARDRRRAAVGEGRRAQSHRVVQGARHERRRHARARRSAFRDSSCRRRATPARRSPRTAPRRGFPCASTRRRRRPRRFSTRSARSAPTCSSSTGHIGDAGKQARAFAAESGYFDVSTLREPYRIEGKKTMGIELAEQLGWRLPTHIIYPTGGGTGLIGMWKVFAEMRDGGWLPKDDRAAAHDRRAGRRLRADRARVRRPARITRRRGRIRRRTRADCACPVRSAIG